MPQTFRTVFFRWNKVEILGYKSVCTLEKKVKTDESYSLNYLKC